MVHFFGAWSATVMRNIFINDVRWNSRYHFEDLTPVSARIDNSGDHLVHEEILETVRKLPPYLHEPITMYIDGFPTKRYPTSWLFLWVL